MLVCEIFSSAICTAYCEESRMRRLKGTKKQPALSATKEARPSPSRHWPHLVILSLLLEILGVICLQLKYAVLDLDLWLHLRAGEWILEHRSFPHTDPF